MGPEVTIGAERPNQSYCLEAVERVGTEETAETASESPDSLNYLNTLLGLKDERCGVLYLSRISSPRDRAR